MDCTPVLLGALLLAGVASASLNKPPAIPATPELSYYQVSTKMVACDVREDAEELVTVLDSGTDADRSKFEANPRSCFGLNLGAGLIVETTMAQAGVVRAVINEREVIYIPLSVVQMQTLIASH